MERATREQIVAEARSWAGTRFLHQGRKKREGSDIGGCDCIGLIVGVAKALELPSQVPHISRSSFVPLHGYDVRSYAREPDGVQLEAALEKLFNRKSAEQIAPADILLFRIQHQPQHVALASDYAHGGVGMIHSHATARQVVEHRLDDAWRKKLIGVFQFPFLTE